MVPHRETVMMGCGQSSIRSLCRLSTEAKTALYGVILFSQPSKYKSLVSLNAALSPKQMQLYFVSSRLEMPSFY